MRYWISIIVVIGALLCAVALAPLFRQDAGYVLIELGQWTIESNVLVLLGMLLLLMIALKLLFWFLSLPRLAAANLARRRLENGLLALAEGDWQQAEKSLSRAAGNSVAPVAGYLAAARAADGHDGEPKAIAQRQQGYLEAADDGHARTRFLIHLSKARLLINKGQYEQAIPLLQHCLKQRRRHRQALRMLAQCHRELGQWSLLRGLLPAMRKAGLLDRSSSADLERLSINNELASAEDAEQLQKSWDSLLRGQRQQVDSIAHYAQKALQFDFPRLAESVLIQALDREPDPVLADLYVRAHLEPVEKALQRAQKWQRKNPDDAGIQRLLGQLYLQDEKWGKARDHLQESLRLHRDAATYTVLGKLLQQQGDSDAAANCFFNALQLGTSVADQRQASPSAQKQLAPAPLRPLYSAKAIGATAPEHRIDAADSAGKEETQQSDSPPARAATDDHRRSAESTGANGNKTEQTRHDPPPHGTEQVPVKDLAETADTADTDDAMGDVASVPADFQPSERGAKSKES
jgi:HemY protein